MPRPPLPDPRCACVVHALITVSQFLKGHPGLLRPAFEMQVSLINKLLGEKFWNAMAKHRMVTEAGTTTDAHNILNAHIDDDEFKVS